MQANDLWIEDRNFCTCAFLCEIDCRGAGFITRQHEGLRFEPVDVLRSVGRIETGHVAEQRVQVWDAQGGVHLFRRIQVKLDQATRDGDRVLYILTNFPCARPRPNGWPSYIASAGRWKCVNHNTVIHTFFVAIIRHALSPETGWCTLCGDTDCQLIDFSALSWRQNPSVPLPCDHRVKDS